jgi:hypothetical protein
MLIVIPMEEVVTLNVPGIETRVVGTRESPIERLRAVVDECTRVVS